MEELKVKEKDIVIPGELLAAGMGYLPGQNTYRKGDQVYSKVLGLVYLSGRAIKICPLAGPYVPKAGDKIIGKIIDIAMTGWRIKTNTAYSAMLNIKDSTTRYVRRDEDLSKIMGIGDYVVVKITKVTSQKLIDLTMKEPGLRKITGGRIIKINSQKVPRVIGKEGSMVSLIKNKTRCEISIGQNGLVWVKGTPENELLAEKAVHLVAEKSHLSGLTDKVNEFLIKSTENKVEKQ
tara:strand:+ start:604 stop:1308 length:705 start_codon:yes stop_codon:yes gene_type:complete